MRKLSAYWALSGYDALNHARIIPMVDYTAKVVKPPSHFIFGAKEAICGSSLP